MGIPEHVTCLFRILYVDQEATVRTKHETKVWFKIGKGVQQGHKLSPCLFNFNAQYIMRNVGWMNHSWNQDCQERNTNNFRYAGDTTLMAESEEEVKSLLVKVIDESEKAGLKHNIKKTKIMASSPITSWQIEGEKVEAVTDFIFLGFKITVDGDCSHKIKRHLHFGRKAMTNLDSIKNQRRHLANKSLYSQNYGFSRGHVQM